MAAIVVFTDRRETFVVRRGDESRVDNMIVHLRDSLHEAIDLSTLYIPVNTQIQRAVRNIVTGALTQTSAISAVSLVGGIVTMGGMEDSVINNVGTYLMEWQLTDVVAAGNPNRSLPEGVGSIILEVIPDLA